MHTLYRGQNDKKRKKEKLGLSISILYSREYFIAGYLSTGFKCICYLLILAMYRSRKKCVTDQRTDGPRTNGRMDGQKKHPELKRLSEEAHKNHL